MADLGKFVHLHVHSQYSTLDGANTLKSLVSQTKKLGMSAVALTDHGNLFGAYNFQKTCQEGGVKPIIGCETYLSPTHYEDRTSQHAKSRFHFLLLCQDLEGYRNLCRLNTLSYTKGFYYKPRIDKALLEKHSKGLIATSTCLASSICQALLEGSVDKAQREVDDFVQIFGPENFYIELMDHGLPEQKKVNEGLLEIARKGRLPLIATNDCHYLTKKAYDAHDVMLCIQMGKTLGDPDRMRFERNEFYLKSPDEMIKQFGHLTGAIDNTLAIAERCNCVIPTNQKLLPRFRTPNDEPAAEYMRSLVHDRLKTRYRDHLSATQIDRADFEMDVIESMGFVDYFLVVWDFIQWAKDHDIPVGPGRGSGAGSIVAYALGITDLEPLEHGLLFERFLNPERVSMPDFDIDFCYERRGEVIEYVRRKYGEECVAQIITFGTMKAKNSIRDVGRVMQVELDKVNRIAKLVPGKPGVQLKEVLGLEDLSQVDDQKAEELRRLISHELKEMYETDDQTRELIDRAMAIEGAIRQPGTHAAGVVICDQPLIDIIPLYKPAGEEAMVATQYTMTEVEEIGLLKMDFLGLKNLTVIDRTIKSVNRRFGKSMTAGDIPIEADEKTWKLLQAGKGLGVFQLESGGMRDLLVNFRPQRFAELVALISLYRPGPMDNIPTYIARKEGREKIEFDHPDLEPILKETYGLFVYQEQVMQVAQVMGGYSLGGADLLRRAMGKKKAEAMAKERSRFQEGAAGRGVDAAVAERVFNTMEKFASYGFNKSHAAAYAVISVQTAWLKANYPIDFFSALLTNEIGGDDTKLSMCFDELKVLGIRVLPPDINTSGLYFTPDEGDIRFGLAAIKGVGENAVRAIMTEREKDGEFRSLQDFAERMDKRQVNMKTLEALISCGAFDRFGFNRPSLLAALPKIGEVMGFQRDSADNPQTNLFAMLNEEQAAGLNDEIAIPRKPDWTDKERLDKEKELVGFFLSGHPLQRYEPDFDAFSTHSVSEILKLEDKQNVVWVGMVKKMIMRTDKNGDQFCIAEMEDMTGTIEATFFSRTFVACREHLKEGNVLVLHGRTDTFRDTRKILVNQALSIEAVREDRIKVIEIMLAWRQVTEASMTALKEILARHKGRRKIWFCLTEGADEVRIASGSGLGIKPSSDLIGELQDHLAVLGVRFVARNGNGNGSGGGNGYY